MPTKQDGHSFYETIDIEELLYLGLTKSPFSTFKENRTYANNNLVIGSFICNHKMGNLNDNSGYLIYFVCII